MTVRLIYLAFMCQSFLLGITGMLHQPINVTTESRNFRLFLRWLPAPENPPSITYNVYFKSAIRSKWKPIKLCRNITTTECDLTCSLSDYTRNHSIRVRALYNGSKSSWTTIHNISYMFSVDPDPPILQVKKRDKTILINATIELQTCFFYMYDLKYETIVWLDGKQTERYHLKEEYVNTEVDFKTPGLTGNYCVAAKTKYTVHLSKWSKYSRPVCQLMTFKAQKGNELPLILGLTGSLLLLFCGLSLFFCNRWQVNGVKMPKVLDFSQYKFPLVVSESTERFLEKCEINIEHRKDPCSTVVSLSGDDFNEDTDTSCNFGYTEKRMVHGETTEGKTRSAESTCYKQKSSRGTLVDSSCEKYSLSDDSCEECENSAETTIGKSLSQVKIQSVDCMFTINKVEDITEIANPLEFPLVPPASLQTQQPMCKKLCELVERQCIQMSDNKQHVCFSSLKIADINGEIESSEDESSDQFLSDLEDLKVQLDEDIMDSDTDTNPYTVSKDIGLQNRCTGYQQRS